MRVGEVALDSNVVRLHCSVTRNKMRGQLMMLLKVGENKWISINMSDCDYSPSWCNSIEGRITLAHKSIILIKIAKCSCTAS